MDIESIIGSVNIFVSYFLLIVVLSSFILKPRLRDVDVVKRFIIYVVFGNLYISTIVFILSYLNIFNRPTLIISTVLLSIFIRVILNIKEFKNTVTYLRNTVSNLILGKYGVRLFVSEIFNKIKIYIKTLFNELTKGRKIEWLIFLALIAYNVYQYGSNMMTYVAPDEEVHFYWIQSLIKGEIYPSGVYPHVFHNIIAAIIELFNINPITVIQSFSIISCILIMTMLYIGLRKIFNSKYPALFGFLIFTVANLFIEGATRRYQFSIPQEYGMIMLIPLAIFLMDYIRNKDIKDLLFFSFALSLTVSIHFYTGIIGVLLTLSIVFVYLYKIIKERLTLKLILSGILSVVIAIAPLATGLALGHEMEQSMSWATDVIKGDIYTGTNDDPDEIEGEAKQELKEEDPEDNFSVEEKVKRDLIKYGFINMKVAYFFITMIIFTIIYNIILILLKRGTRTSGYKLVFAVNSLILFLLIIFKALGLPTIMEPKRVTIYFAYLSPIWLGMPLEFLIALFRGKSKRLIPFISITTMVLSLFVIIKTNSIRPIPAIYYFQTSGTMRTNLSIMKEYEDFTWTAVSPVNNISSILNNGYHYELSDFIVQQENWDKDKELTIPTEYVFVYIEKRPIVSYGERFDRLDKEIVNRDFVTKEDALKDFSYKDKENYIYTDERSTLMSKAYYWAKEYEKYFSKEMNVYYEDDELIVYRIKQNMYALNNFNIDYKINRE